MILSWLGITIRRCWGLRLRRGLRWGKDILSPPGRVNADGERGGIHGRMGNPWLRRNGGGRNSSPWKSSAEPVVGQKDLLWLEARCGLPIERAVHGLAHASEPPLGSVQAAFTLRGAGAAIRSRQSQFHLLLIRHTIDLSFYGAIVEEGVGQRLSKTSKDEKYFGRGFRSPGIKSVGGNSHPSTSAGATEPEHHLSPALSPASGGEGEELRGSGDQYANLFCGFSAPVFANGHQRRRRERQITRSGW